MSILDPLNLYFQSQVCCVCVGAAVGRFIVFQLYKFVGGFRHSFKIVREISIFTLSIGEPITGCFYFIVVDDSRLAGIEEEGELWVGGLGVAHS